MATEKYPNQNVNMPYKQGHVDAARARLDPGRVGPPSFEAGNGGKGSRREVRPGEWVDDRRLDLDKPASPSKDSPPELAKGRSAPPATYDAAKVYMITLGKGAVFAGRMLSPGKTYQMAGYACTEIAASVIDAVEVGAVPVDPDSQPS